MFIFSHIDSQLDLTAGIFVLSSAAYRTKNLSVRHASSSSIKKPTTKVVKGYRDKKKNSMRGLLCDVGGRRSMHALA